MIIRYEDQTDPDVRLAWYDADGTTLRNLVGWTIAVEVIDRTTGYIEMTKTTGVTGGDGTGAYNVDIAWTAVELGDLAGGRWNLRVTATNGAERAVFTVNSRGSLPVLEVRPAPVVATP